MAYETELEQAQTARGLEDPTLSFNPSGANDYSPAQQFIDLMHMNRSWIGHEPGRWGGATTADLREGGFLDADGWPTEIPEHLDSIGTVWAWGDMPEGTIKYDGTYVLEYEGEGTLVLGGNAEIISEEPGRIVFENPTGGTFMMAIKETDPNGTGDYIRDISIVAEEYVPLHEAGALFNPLWLETIQDARELRFMDWMETNNSDVTSWDEMQSANGPRTDGPMPVEYMVRLANETGIDPWFTMPHQADEEFIRNFAEYVDEHLDPELTVRVEYSNEVWNWAFQQTHWLHEQSFAEWGEHAFLDYHAKKAVETALIWEEVFGDDADGRLINVLGTQAVNPWISNRLLNPEVWERNEPDTFVDPATVFEELATTTYFGSATVSDADMRADLINQIQDPNVDAAAWLTEQLLDPDYRGSIPLVAESLEATAAVAHEHGLTLVAYEGGQHVHHSFAVSDLSDEDVAALNDFMIDFVRSDHMADLYEELWDVWAAHGDGAFMQFGDVGRASKWGSWALPTPWWEEAEGGEFRQQGVIETGTAQADMMIGTSQEDYLMGMDGDDTFVAGAKNDGINGGAGTDRVVLSGTSADYTLREEGDGYRITGIDGSDYLFDIEELAFAGGSGENGHVVKLADLAMDENGFFMIAAQETAEDDPDTVGGDPDTGGGDPDANVGDQDAGGGDPDADEGDPDASGGDPDADVGDQDTTVDDPDTSGGNPDADADDQDTTDGSSDAEDSDTGTDGAGSETDDDDPVTGSDSDMAKIVSESIAIVTENMDYDAVWDAYHGSATPAFDVSLAKGAPQAGELAYCGEAADHFTFRDAAVVSPYDYDFFG